MWLVNDSVAVKAAADQCVLHMSAEEVKDAARRGQLHKRAGDHEAAEKRADEEAVASKAKADEAAAAAASQAERDANAPALDGPLAPGCRVRLDGGGWTGQVGWVTGVSVSKGTVWLGFEGRCYMVRRP